MLRFLLLRDPQDYSRLTVSGNSVTVRGVSSIGSSTPLFVVNGTTVSSVNGIDPAMVKSIEVLKGPSASVYGLQGANGVIIIRLKVQIRQVMKPIKIGDKVPCFSLPIRMVIWLIL